MRLMIRSLALLSALTLASACPAGEVDVVGQTPAPHDQGGHDGAPDLPSPTDAPRDTPPDGGLDAPEDAPDETGCDDASCGAHARCDAGACQCDAGFEGDPDAGCTPIAVDPCAQVSCAQGALCRQGQCQCAPGFSGDPDSGCVAAVVGDTAQRDVDEVCARWNQDHPLTSQQQWQLAPADQCDPGVLHPDVQADALRRTSLFRWLVGLPPVTLATSQLVNAQACATTLDAHDVLTHSITPAFTCYSPEAAAGAGNSNLAQGVSSAAASIDLYVGDRGVPSLGHRRWVLNPGMGATAFGLRGRYSCMYAFDSSQAAPAPDYVAYPAPGPFPLEALLGDWSFKSTRYSFDAQTAVAMRDVQTGQAIATTNLNIPGGNYGIPALSWRVAQGKLVTGRTIEITVSGLRAREANMTVRAQVVYQTTLARCR